MQENPKEQEQPTPESSVFENVFDSEREQYEASMKKARTWLYIISGIQFCIGIYEWAITNDKTIAIFAFGIDAFIALVFLLLALWSSRVPVAAFTTALIFYIVIIIGLGVLDPMNFVRGIIVKVFVIIALIKANRDARRNHEIKSL